MKEIISVYLTYISSCGCKAFNGLLHHQQILLDKFLMIREVLFVRIHPRLQFFCGHHHQTGKKLSLCSKDLCLTENIALLTHGLHKATQTLTHNFKDDCRGYKKLENFLLFAKNIEQDLYIIGKCYFDTLFSLTSI